MTSKDLKKSTRAVTLLILLCIVIIGPWIIFAIIDDTPPEMTFEWKRIPDSGPLNSIIVDGNDIFVAGSTHDPDDSRSDILLLRYDIDGRLVWRQEWGSGAIDYPKSMFLENGFIYVVGKSHGDAVLLVYDTDGELEWNRTWERNGTSIANSVYVHKGFIYIAGITRPRGFDVYDAFLLKYNLDGDLIWDRVMEPDRRSGFTGICIESDFIYAVGRVSTDWLTPSPFLFKYDLDGNHIWNISLPDYNPTISDIEASSGYLYMTGYIPNDVILLKYDTNGTLFWMRTWGGEDLGDSGDAIHIDGKYIYVTGDQLSYAVANPDLFVLKYDSSGNLIWARVWDGWNARGNDVYATSGSVYIVAQEHVHGNVHRDEGFIVRYEEEMDPFLSILFLVIIAVIAAGLIIFVIRLRSRLN